MSNDDIARPRYYERQYLGTRDFQDEQAYHIEMRRRHNIAHHTWGIASGLEVVQDTTTSLWVLQPGFAIDGYGREIIVAEPEPLNLLRIKDRVSDQSTLPATLEVWISYLREHFQSPKPGYEVCGEEDQFTRLRETFEIVYQDDPPGYDALGDLVESYEATTDDPEANPWPVWLGTLTWDTDPSDSSSQTVTKVIAEGRRYVGLRAAELSASQVAQSDPVTTPPYNNALTLRGDSITATGMETDERTRVTVEGDLEVDGSIDFREDDGSDNDVTLTASREQTDLRLKIGEDVTKSGRLVVGPGTDEKVVIEGDGTTTVDGELTLVNSNNLQLKGGGVVLRNEDGTEIPGLTEITRNDSDLRLGIGTPTDPARLIVGPKDGDDVGENFIVENEGDVTICGSLIVKGNIAPGGTVDGRDVAADGATLDGLSNQMDDLSDLLSTIESDVKITEIDHGEMDSGYEIPLPGSLAETDTYAWLATPLPPFGSDLVTGLLANTFLNFYTAMSYSGRTVTVTHWIQPPPLTTVAPFPVVPVPSSPIPGKYRYIIIGLRDVE